MRRPDGSEGADDSCGRYWRPVVPEDPAVPLPFVTSVAPAVDDVRRVDSREPLVAVEAVADPVVLDEDRPDVDRDDVDVAELPDGREPAEPEELAELEVVELDEFEAADELELDEAESDEPERDESAESEEGDDGSPFIRFRTYVSCPSRS